MRSEIGSTLAVGLGLALVAWTAAARQESGKPAPSVVATVGSLEITREDFERRAALGLAEYEKRRGQPLTGEFQALVERQALEGLIRSYLLILEAQRSRIAVSDAEAEAQLKGDPFFNPNGTFSEALFLKVKTNDPKGFQQALQKTRLEVAGRKLGERIQQQHRPEEAEIRARAERSLSRAAIEYLALLRREIPGDYPEPRESAVLDYYRTHADEFHRPARATLSLVRIDQPPLSESNKLSDRRAWEAQMKQRADSALAAIHAGGSFEAIAAGFGGVRKDVVVNPGNFPGFWRGSDRVNQAVFRHAPGSVLQETVPAERGFLLVRVDAVRPAAIAPLREVARQIRATLREDARLHHEERELRALYESRRDSLRGPAYRLRYAVADTGLIDPGEPSAADLDRYYRAHLADYTSYDAATASVVVKPLAEVRSNARSRWRREQRLLLSKSLAERLEQAWSRGARDRNLERAATLLREVGPLPIGAVVDTGRAGKALTDTLANRGIRTGVGVATFPRGMIVYHVHEMVPDYTPSFEQIRPVLAERNLVERQRENERNARALFDKDPEQFGSGPILNFSRISFEPMPIADVPLTRAEVERYHKEHIDKYSVAEQIRASHILISPTEASPEADAAARKKAEDLLRRVRAGEDFATLAREFSDDPPTKDKGGDLDFFARGAMLEEFERAAFALKPGEVSDLVKTEVGYHIIKVTDHQPMIAEPLVQIYANVGADAATEKAQRLALQMADSIYQQIRTPEDARAVARQLNLEVERFRHEIGNTRYPELLRPVMARLEKVPMGKLYPGVVDLKTRGAAIQWPDSVTPGGVPSWEQAHERAVQAYLRDAGGRTLQAKRAELDSMMSAGWSFDSIAALWGGVTSVDPLKPGAKIRDLGDLSGLDSLVFGGAGRAPMDPGQLSGWVTLPSALVRVRLKERIQPSPSQLASRMESERRLALERSLFGYYQDLKKRYMVRILDPKLREVILPPPPPEPSSL